MRFPILRLRVLADEIRGRVPRASCFAALAATALTCAAAGCGASPIDEEQAFEATGAAVSGIAGGIVVGIWPGNNDWQSGSDEVLFDKYRSASMLGWAGGYRPRGGFGQFEQPGPVKDLAYAQQKAAAGMILMTNLNPRVGTSSNKTPIKYQDVLDGKYDALLDDFAADLKAIPGPVVVELHSEANIGSSGAQPEVPDGPGDQGRFDSPERRKRFGAWVKYIRDRWTKKGATNVLYALSIANGQKFAHGGASGVDPWFQYALPYLDIVGVDAYSQAISKTPRNWQSLFGDAYAWAKAHGKPLAILETACQPGAGDGSTAGTSVKYTDKASWLSQGLAWSKAHSDTLEFVVFNLSADGSGGEPFEDNASPLGKGAGDGYGSASWKAAVKLFSDPAMHGHGD